MKTYYEVLVFWSFMPHTESSITGSVKLTVVGELTSQKVKVLQISTPTPSSPHQFSSIPLVLGTFLSTCVQSLLNLSNTVMR